MGWGERGRAGKLQDLLSWASDWSASVVGSASLETGPSFEGGQHLSSRRDTMENVQFRLRHSVGLLCV